MDPPRHPQHQPFTRPSLFAGSHDLRGAGLPPRQYAPAPSLPNGRSQPSYDPLGRRESENSGPLPTYGYPPHSYAHEKPVSPVPFASLRNDGANGFHARPPSHGSMMKHNDRVMKDHNTMYREGPPSHTRDMHPAASHDQSRRPSLGSSGSPVFANGPQEPQPSAAHSFGSRQMPPPSPPQHYPPRGPPATGPPPPPPSYPSHEPHSSLMHRSGSSMSILSMLGSDSDRPSRDPGSGSIFSRPPVSSAPFGTAPPPPTAGAMSPPTAPSRQPSMEYPLFRRSQTPDKPFPKNQPNQPPRLYRSSSGGASQPHIPDASRFGGLPRAQPFSQYPEKPSNSQVSPQISSAESPYNESRRLSLNGPIQRPSSQPQHGELSSRPPGFSPLVRPNPGLTEAPPGIPQRTGSYPGIETQHRYNGLYQDRQAEEKVHRERDGGPGPGPDSKHPSHGQPRYAAQFPEREPERQHTAPPWEAPHSQPVSPESKRFPAPEPASEFGFGAIQSYTKSLGSQLGSRQPPSLSIQARQGQPTPPPNEQAFLGNALNKLQTQPRLFTPTSAPSTGQPSFGSSASEEQRRKGSDELMQHRNLLGVGNDGKRGGRASPLPQAVQGAQAQIIGPAGESGIKGELGRVFSGIGSGVGGVTAPPIGSGPPTPMTASPFKRDSVTGRATNGEATDDGKTGRGVPGPGRRARKPKDEEVRVEADSGAEQRATTSSRGRRGRHVHRHHHHHHHHRQKNEEEASVASHRPPSASLNLFHRTSTPSEGSGVSGAAPGYHHHHHHHHHHHVPRTVSSGVGAPPPPTREPNVFVNLEPLLKSVADLPRHHLGSTLYAPRIGVPTPSANLDSAKFGYTSTPVPIPRFEGKENCTFTIRVPRFRIDAGHREEICARRALWGTGVYTDDSDPVAAAIHSGFIRGEWGEDVDVDMLDLEIKDTYQHAPRAPDETGSNSKGPRVPPVPPPDKDLHITLLILPPLERYESSVLFGLKSRSWDGHHDGMSFKVERVEWVDEGVTRGEERSGEARRKRLRHMMRSGRICTGPGLLKLQQLRGGGAELARRKIGMGLGGGEGGSAPVETVS